jgi:hypothetical protein
MKWVSHWQLYADLTGSTGMAGPIKLNGWRNGDDIPHLGLKGFPFKLRARWFIKLLKECLRHLGQKIDFAVGLPHSQMIKTHTGLFALPWPEHGLTAIDSWMYACIPHAFFRQSKAVDALPLVFDIAGLSKVVFSMV